MNEHIIDITTKEVYGNTLYYPANENGNLFCNLTGTKTITVDMIQTIKKLGYVFRMVNDSKSFPVALI